MNDINDRKFQLVEQVNKPFLGYIIDNADRYDVGGGYVKGQSLDRDGSLTLLSKYYESLDDKGVVTTNYHQRNNFGRYWASTFGLANMSRKVRHSICRDVYYDIDMKNAHPTLLSYYCHKHGIPCEHLDTYISNRDVLIREMMDYHGFTKDECKKELLVMLNGGKRDVSQSLQWIKDYYDGMRSIHNAIMLREPHYLQLAIKSKTYQGKKGYNIEGTTTNYVMCNLENMVLMYMYDFFKLQGISVGVLVFDGLMIEKSLVTSQRLEVLLTECSEGIYKDFGIKIPILEKQMDEGYEVPADLSAYQKQIPFQDPDVLVKSLFNKAESDYVTISQIPEDVKYVKPITFPSLRNCVVIHSPLGSGKTTSITKYILRYNPKRVLVLSPRQTFAKSICHEYNEKIGSVQESFSCYLDIKPKSSKIPTCDRLVLSMESLHYLHTVDLQSNPFDLLIVDECQSNLTQHVCVETNGKNLELNIGMFEDLLHSSDKIIFADAFIGSKTLHFLHHNQIPTHVYEYQTKMTPRTAMAFDNDTELFDKLRNSLSKNERNYVFMSSKNKAMIWSNTIQELYPEKKVVTLTGGSIVYDVRKEWGDADLVIVTSTVTVGINFDIPDHFHNVFIYASCRAKNLIADIFQGHYRVRNLINNRVYFAIYDIANCKLSLSTHFLTSLIDWKADYFEQRHSCFTEASLPIRQLVIDNIFECNMSIMKIKQMFYYYLRLCGYTLIENCDRTVVDALITDILQEKKDNLNAVTPLEDVPLLTLEQCNKLRSNKMAGAKLSEDEILQLEKKVFISCFVPSDDEEQFLQSSSSNNLWNLWCKNGRHEIYNLRNEKKIHMGICTLDNMYLKASEKCSLSCVQNEYIVQLEIACNIVRKLGLDNSQDCGKVVKHSILCECVDFVKLNLQTIQKAYALRDRRKDKLTFTFNNYVDTINQVLVRHSFTKIAGHGPKQKTVKGKKVLITDRDHIVKWKTNKKDTVKLYQSVWDSIKIKTPTRVNPVITRSSSCTEEILPKFDSEN